MAAEKNLPQEARDTPVSERSLNIPRKNGCRCGYGWGITDHGICWNKIINRQGSNTKKYYGSRQGQKMALV